MKKLIVIAGCIGIVALGLLFGQFVGGQDYGMQAQAKLEQSDKLLEEARVLSCKGYGDLFAACFKREKGACAKMHAAEQEYSLHFSADPRQECESDATVAELEEEQAPPVDEPSQQETADVAPPSQGIETPRDPHGVMDPLFRGDEEGGTY